MFTIMRVAKRGGVDWTTIGKRAASGLFPVATKYAKAAIGPVGTAYAVAEPIVSTVLDVIRRNQSTPKGRTRYTNAKNQTKLAVKRRYGTTTGRHAGFIGKHRRMGRVYRRRHRKAVVGVQFCREVLSNVTDNRCVWFGHYTMPSLEVMKYTVYALLKRLWNKAGIQFSSFNDPILGALNTGYQVGIEYRISPLVGLSAVSYTVAVTDTTFLQVADGFWTIFYNTFINPGVAVSVGTQTTWTKLYLNDGTENTDQLMLTNALVSVESKCSMKFQNRSINTVDDDEMTDVNNVPLIGRSYQINGNTPVARDLSAVNAVTGAMNPCSPVNGFTSYGAGATTALQEPVEPGFFAGKIKSYKLQVGPGQIKTSVLNENKKILFNTLVRYTNGIYRNASGGDRIYSPMGKSRLIALERSIGRLGTETEPGIQVTVEHDLKMFIGVYLESGTYTGPINIVA